jgi:hypothetical protein
MPAGFEADPSFAREIGVTVEIGRGGSIRFKHDRHRRRFRLVTQDVVGTTVIVGVEIKRISENGDIVFRREASKDVGTAELVMPWSILLSKWRAGHFDREK